MSRKQVQAWRHVKKSFTFDEWRSQPAQPMVPTGIHTPTPDQSTVLPEWRCLCDACWSVYPDETRAGVLLFLHDHEVVQRREHHGSTWAWTPKAEKTAGWALRYDEWIAEQVVRNRVEDDRAVLL